MAVEWFYTTSKQQMGPVSWKELLELAQGGILKPHDMVWSEGMAEWVKAINQKGLFAEDDIEEMAGAKKSSYAQPKPPPGRRTRRRDEDEEDEADERESKRDARKRKEEKAKMAVGVKVGLILGGVVFVLLLLGCAGGGLIWLSFRDNPRRVANPPQVVNNMPPNVNPGPGPKAVGAQNYVVQNLQQGQQNERQFQFQQGRRVIITSTNNIVLPDTDVDLYVIRRNHPNPIAWDTEVPNFDRNCRVEFVVPATDTYVIRLVNLGPGMARSCNVTIEER